MASFFLNLSLLCKGESRLNGATDFNMGWLGKPYPGIDIEQAP